MMYSNKHVVILYVSFTYYSFCMLLLYYLCFYFIIMMSSRILNKVCNSIYAFFFFTSRQHAEK